MLTLPPSEPSKKSHSVKPLRRVGRSREAAGGGGGGGGAAEGKLGRMSPSVLDDEVFLTAGEVAEYPAGLRSVAARAVGGELKETSLQSGTRTEIEREMDSCETDVALFQFLDNKIFSVMETGSVEDRAKLRDGYPLILLKAMKMFRVMFGRPLVAMTFFLKVKTLSAESYVLGCTTQLYNELLLARWERFTDLSSVMDILEEMNLNGLRGDGQTIQILQRIQDDVKEWVTEGNELELAVWKEEKDKMTKLDKIRREMIDKIEMEVDVGAMEQELEKEVDLMDTKGQDATSPAEQLV